ncbi:MAG TPA: hypothetical protein VFM44_11370 [Gemmatimonadota bacterium]|nr:hypothetical protein [Gemmatimonadota bacterium]
MLAYEVALVQLLAITHWAHFAAMVISLALLGFGASGSALAIGRRWIAGREGRAYRAVTLLAGLAYDPAYRIAARIPFDAFELIAVPQQFLWLTLSYLVLAVPFFLAGSAVALAFEIGRASVGRVYAANLLGSGAGAVLGLALLSWLPAERLPAGIAVVGLLAVAPLARWGVAVATAGLIGAVLLPPPAVPRSQYKDGTLALRLPEARVVAIHDGPLGRLEMIESPVLRVLPGASLALRDPVPPRPVLYLDGQTIGPRAEAGDAALWSMTTSAAAFALPDSALRVLFVGAGGGGLVWLARADARSISVVDPDERLDPLLEPGVLEGVHRFTASPRGWLHGNRERFDRVVVGQPGSLAGSAAGMSAAGADYLFTVEGFEDLWNALDEDGVLVITRWVLNPPRDIPRLLATARRVLDGEGLEAGRHVALLRGWSTATLLVSRRPFETGDVAALRSWCEARWFDLTWAPGAPRELANRYNLLDPDWFRLSAEGLLGAEPERFEHTYVFDIEPVTDSAPFFHHFLRAADLLRLWRAEGRLSLPYLEWAIVAQWLVLLLAIPMAAVLILLPLFVLPGASPNSAAGNPEWPASGRPPPRGALFSYFALLGFAFMVLEISAIQRLLLFLAEPAYAMTAVLASFLVFAGLGSALAERVRGRIGGWFPFATIAVLALVTRSIERILWDHAAAAPLAFRMLAAILLLAPLAFVMGHPFPIGLQRVAARAPRWIPWCWGVNGFLSVIGAAATPLIALAVGLDGALLLAAGLYLLSGWVMRFL